MSSISITQTIIATITLKSAIASFAPIKMFPKIVVTAAALIGACQALPSANQLTNDIDSLTNLLATANDKAAELSAVSIFTSAVRLHSLTKNSSAR